jgi:RodZ C-terminal domain
VVGGLVLALVMGLVMTDHIAGDQSESASPATTSSPAKRRPPPPAKRITPTQAVATQPSQAVVHITIAASRGDCWVLARRGSETGPIMVQQLLPQGQRLTLRGPHIWLELGAASNVDISVNGKARSVPAGTTSMLLG